MDLDEEVTEIFYAYQTESRKFHIRDHVKRDR